MADSLEQAAKKALVAAQAVLDHRYQMGAPTLEIHNDLATALAALRSALHQEAGEAISEATVDRQWEPAFDVMSPTQEDLVQQFCAEIAGPLGKRGSPPDPVRLLEMAQALYEAARKDLGPPLYTSPPIKQKPDYEAAHAVVVAAGGYRNGLLPEMFAAAIATRQGTK